MQEAESRMKKAEEKLAKEEKKAKAVVKKEKVEEVKPAVKNDKVKPAKSPKEKLPHEKTAAEKKELIKAEEKISNGMEEGTDVDKAEEKFDEAMNAYDRFDDEDDGKATETTTQKQTLAGVDADSYEAIGMEAPEPENLVQGDKTKKKKKAKKGKKSKKNKEADPNTGDATKGDSPKEAAK